MIKVILQTNISKKHNSQIIQGYIMLAEAGKISLDIINIDDMPNALVIANINNKKVIYDTLDSYDNIFHKYLDNCNIYFKRSFDSKNINDIKDSIKDNMKFYPLGLNYAVDIDRNYLINKNINSDILNNRDYFKHTEFEYKENIKYEYDICFLTRLWDPESSEVGIHEKREERNKINNIRVDCLNELKQKYGSNGIFGLSKDEYSFKKNKELVLSNTVTDKKSFLDIVKKSKICVCTTGLHNSIGWRFAEYIAAGKVIITEKLNSELPGDLIENKNYLQFETKEELFNNIERLINDQSLQKSIEENNKKYYRKYLKPDKLVENTLKYVI